MAKTWVVFFLAFVGAAPVAALAVVGVGAAPVVVAAPGAAPAVVGVGAAGGPHDLKQ